MSLVRQAVPLVLGSLLWEPETDRYYNAVVAVPASPEGEAARPLPQFYRKRGLVPFAEVFPVPDWVREYLRLMALPYSDFSRGPVGQAPLEPRRHAGEPGRGLRFVREVAQKFRARDRLLVERPQVLDAAATASDDQQVSLTPCIEALDGSGDLGGRALALHLHRGQHDADAGPADRKSTR